MEPTPEEAAEGSILCKVLAAVLERLVNSNTSIARSDPGQVTKFHALKAPGIGVEAYLERYVMFCYIFLFFLYIIILKPLLHFDFNTLSLSHTQTNKQPCSYHILLFEQGAKIRFLLQRVLHLSTDIH
ncbi:MAG: hypothetical protein ACI90V_007830 [Bacillariaceae sp.]|jgi:hypothetical protein